VQLQYLTRKVLTIISLKMQVWTIRMNQRSKQKYDNIIIEYNNNRVYYYDKNDTIFYCIYYCIVIVGFCLLQTTPSDMFIY
jgi:hypothetical protein